MIEEIKRMQKADDEIKIMILGLSTMELEIVELSMFLEDLGKKNVKLNDNLIEYLLIKKKIKRCDDVIYPLDVCICNEAFEQIKGLLEPIMQL